MKQRVRSQVINRCVVIAFVGMLATAWWGPAVRAGGLPGKWVEVRTPHFVVVSNAGRRSASEIAEHFEQIRELFTQALPGRIAESGPPLRVFAVNGERTLKQLIPRYWEQGRVRPTGVFRGTPTGTQVAVRADLLGDGNFGTIYHEYFHFLAFSTGVKIPTWLNEGLASYWGSTRLTSKAAEVGRPDIPKLERLRQGFFLPLDELMAVDRSSPHYSGSDKARQFYAQSWALTHYLMLGDPSGKGVDQLADYLRRVAAGEPGHEAAQRAFGNLAELESRLKAYTRKLRFPYAELAPPTPLAEDQGQVRDLPRAEAAALAALFRLESRRTKDIEGLLNPAQKGAPNLLETQTATGLLHLWKREYDAAWQAFQQAVRLADANPLSHYGFAVLQFYRDSGPESLKTVEQHLKQALTLDSEFAPAKARLAEVYRRTETCSEQALIHIRGAGALVPQYSVYPLKEAQILQQCGSEVAARAIVRRLVDEAVDTDDASENNRICWAGSKWGMAKEVLPACDRAVALNPESYRLLDSRGVARALLGDLEGAAADLRAALERSGEDPEQADFKAQRSTWLRSLESQENPFAGDRGVSLLDDPAVKGEEWWL